MATINPHWIGDSTWDDWDHGYKNGLEPIDAEQLKTDDGQPCLRYPKNVLAYVEGREARIRDSLAPDSSAPPAAEPTSLASV